MAKERVGGVAWVSCAASSMKTKLLTTPMVLILMSPSSVYCNRTEKGVLVWYVKKEERKEKRRRAERGVVREKKHDHTEVSQDVTL